MLLALMLVFDTVHAKRRSDQGWEGIAATRSRGDRPNSFQASDGIEWHHDDREHSVFKHGYDSATLGKRNRNLAAALTRAYFADEWSNNIPSIPDLSMPSTLMQFQVDRTDALFLFDKPPALVGRWYYAVIDWQLDAWDRRPRQFLIRFSADGDLNCNGFQVYAAWTDTDISQASQDHYYNNLLDEGGNSIIDAMWNNHIAIPTDQANKPTNLAYLDGLQHVQSGTTSHLLDLRDLIDAS